MPKAIAFRSVFYLNIANFNGSGHDHWEPIHEARYSGSTHYSEAVKLRKAAQQDWYQHYSKRWLPSSFRTVKVIGAVDR